MTELLKKSVTAHVPGALAERLAQAAVRQDRSNNWVVNQALEMYLTIEEEQHARTLKALDDAKAGRVISHERMKAWVGGLGKPSQAAQKRDSKH